VVSRAVPGAAVALAKHIQGHSRMREASEGALIKRYGVVLKAEEYSWPSRRVTTYDPGVPGG